MASFSDVESESKRSTLPDSSSAGTISFEVNNGAREVLRLCPDGKILWNGREVKGDEDFRAAMIDVRDSIRNGIGMEQIVGFLRGRVSDCARLLDDAKISTPVAVAVVGAFSARHEEAKAILSAVLEIAQTGGKTLGDAGRGV